MINYSSFSIDQLLAVDEVLDYLTDMLDSDLEAAIVYREYRLAHQAVTTAIHQQARDHAAAEAEKVDRIKKACVAGAPPAEEPDDLQALVSNLSRCSDQLVALAFAEDRRFAESGQMDTFIKLTMLRDANRSIIDLLADIRDHYDGLH